VVEPSIPASEPSRRPVYHARVGRIFDHNADTRSLFLQIADGGRFGFVPGQFISITLPLANETRVRPYTIASGPEDAGGIEICFNRVPGGIGVQYLFDRRVGDSLEFTGPFGAFTMDRVPERACVFIAEGTAIAPIRPMIRRALAAKERPALSLLYGARDREHLLYSDEIARWTSTGIEFVPLVAPAGELYDRLLAEVERRWIAADSERDRALYVCGVGNGVLKIRDALRGGGYERRAVRYERW
jgi:ferredoxin-NADP reductase